MRKTIGKPIEIFNDAKAGLKPTWINLRKGALDSGILLYSIDPTSIPGKV